jgi:hypothetical protein
LQVADEELVHKDASLELAPTRILAVCKKSLNPKPDIVIVELPDLGLFEREVVRLFIACKCSYEIYIEPFEILETSKQDEMWRGTEVGDEPADALQSIPELDFQEVDSQPVETLTFCDTDTTPNEEPDNDTEKLPERGIPLLLVDIT